LKASILFLTKKYIKGTSNTWALASEADPAPDESEHAFLYLSIVALTLQGWTASVKIHVHIVYYKAKGTNIYKGFVSCLNFCNHLKNNQSLNSLEAIPFF